MQKKYLVGKINCETDEKQLFEMEYYVVEDENLYSIEIVKESGNGYNVKIDREVATSFPISRKREVVERIAAVFMRNEVTPMGLLQNIDDLYEI